MPPDHRQRSLGVAIAYHPFLHETILACPGAFDGVEVALDAYLDEARRGLLDPDLSRLRALAEARPISWRGQAFELGSESPPSHAAAAATLARLCGVAGPLVLSERLRLAGPRTPPGCGLRLDPSAVGAARALGREAEALRARLGCELILELPLDRLAEADPASSAIVLGELGAATTCDLALLLGPAVPAPERVARVIDGLPPGRVTRIALTTANESVWPALDAALWAARCGIVVIRRERQLFPIDAVLSAAARARSAMARVDGAAPPDLRPAAPGPACAQTMILEPEEPDDAPRPSPRDVWRARLGDMFKAKQLARWVAQPASWEV